jgi:hypothetical protein
MDKLFTAITGDNISFQSIDRNFALMATIIVFGDMSTAPAAGDRINTCS